MTKIKGRIYIFIVMLLLDTFLSYLIGYNSGYNHGYDNAKTVESDRCDRQMKSIVNGASCRH